MSCCPHPDHISDRRPAPVPRPRNGCGPGPGTGERVTFEIDASQLAYTNLSRRLAVEPARIDVFVGLDSDNRAVEGSFDVLGVTRLLSGAERSFLSTAVVDADCDGRRTRLNSACSATSCDSCRSRRISSDLRCQCCLCRAVTMLQ